MERNQINNNDNQIGQRRGINKTVITQQTTNKKHKHKHHRLAITNTLDTDNDYKSQQQQDRHQYN